MMLKMRKRINQGKNKTFVVEKWWKIGYSESVLSSIDVTLLSSKFLRLFLNAPLERGISSIDVGTF